jgi:hypothetical protein
MGSIPGSTRSYSQRLDRLWGPSNFLSNGLGVAGYIPRGKEAGGVNYIVLN